MTERKINYTWPKDDFSINTDGVLSKQKEVVDERASEINILRKKLNMRI